MSVNNAEVSKNYCRLCGLLKLGRFMEKQYNFMGQSEVYYDILKDCFGIELQAVENEGKEMVMVICSICVVRLRAAFEFKRQILKCEEVLLQSVPPMTAIETSPLLDHRPSSWMDKADEPQIEYTMENIKIEEIDNNHDLVMEEEWLEDFDEVIVNTEEVKNGQNFIQNESQDDENLDKLQTPKNESDDISTNTKSINLIKAINSNNTKIEEEINYSKRKFKNVNENTHKVRRLLKRRVKEIKREVKERRPIGGPRFKKRSIEEIKAADNALTIIENSYVCPFTNMAGVIYCPYCRTGFSNPDDFREHCTIHNPKEFYDIYRRKYMTPKIDITRIDCRLCDEKITDISTLKSHLTETHDLKFFDTHDHLILFKLTHPEVTCLECGDVFLFLDKLIAHMSSHSCTHVCEICGAGFLLHTSLISHIRCHNKSKDMYSCEICGKTFTTNRSRRVHVSVIHEKTSVIGCIKCEATFRSYDQRNKHLNLVHGHKIAIQCSLCSLVLDSRKNLLKHLAYVHKKGNVFSCSYCHKCFAEKSKMKKHEKRHIEMEES